MALGDGLANAPANTPQLPTLLNGYAVRPTWNVAGVDYAVGYASGTILKDPSTISMAGVSVDTVHHVINITGSNVTLSGYDFSLNGGWGVSVNGGSNDIIQNSKFVVGSNGNTPIYVSPNASNVTIQNNLIDGAGSSGTQMLVAADGAGTTTIQYNQIQNAFGQNLVMSSDVGGENWIVQYNVIENAGLGYSSGAHGDWIQTYNLPGCNTNSFQCNYNTFVQNVPIAQGRTQGISAFSANSGADAGGVQTESFNNNTIIANNGAYVNFGVILDTTRLIGTGTVQNNYFDTSNIGSANGGGGSWDFVGAYNGASGGPYHGTVTQSNNANMVSGTYLGGQSGTPPSGTSSGGTSSGGTTAPGAPIIASFSPDTGVVGDGITNHNTITLTGTAAANSTVKVFDGSTQVGTATANASGSWSYSISALSDATHTLTATATNSSGQTSAASSALKVTVDTHAPAAPTIVGDTVNSANQVVISGNAEANSTIKVYEGTTQVGTAVTNSSGAWSVTTSALSAGSHTLTATATDAAGNTSAASSVVDPVVGSSGPSSGSTGSGSVAAPIIASFSTDTGVVGDGITSDNTLELKGTAAANSTIKVYDGATQIGTAAADSTGSWDYITSVLTNAKHMLTATATNSSGQTSAASAALSVTVDTVAPTAPVLVSDSVVNTNHVLLSGTAEANSKITVYDGSSVVGTGTSDLSGSWSVTTSALSNGSHGLQATATDVAGNVSVASQPLGAIIGTTVIEAAGSTSLAQAGSNYFLNPTADGTGPELILYGSPVVAGQFPGWAPVGAEQTSTGYEIAMKAAATNQFIIWTVDSHGNYVTNAAPVSGTSAALESYETSFHQDLNGDGVIGLPASAAATVIESAGATSLAQTGSNYFLNPAAGGTGPELILYGSPVVAGQFPGWAPVGAEQTSTGYEVAMKAAATNQFIIWTVDSHGNYVTNTAPASGTSTTLESYETSFHQDLNGDGIVGVPSAAAAGAAAPLSAVGLTSMSEDSSGIVTIKGTADLYSHIKVYDGVTSAGTVTTGADGTWSFSTPFAVSNTVHTFTAKELDSTGHVVSSSGSAILGTSGSNTLTSSTGNDLLVGNGHPDTFVFAANFGNDVIQDFVAGGWRHDTIQFSKTVFDSFASVMSHASQVGQDVVISTAHDTLTLKDTKLSALNSHDFHFA